MGRATEKDLNGENAYNRVLWEGTKVSQPYPTTER